MTFQDAVKEDLSGLETFWAHGLQALRAQDRPHVKPEDSRNLTGSLDLDKTMKSQYPDANRWDYAIGYQHVNLSEEKIYWIEIHSASDGQISVVLKKFEWLKSWLKNSSIHLKKFKCDYIWVSSGATTFTKTSPQLRQLSQSGLVYAGKVLKIPDTRS
jgi:hypothetical protein